MHLTKFIIMSIIFGATISFRRLIFAMSYCPFLCSESTLDFPSRANHSAENSVLLQLKILGGVVVVFVQTTSLHLYLFHLHMVRATLSINVLTFGTVSQNRQGRRVDNAIRESSS